MMLPTSLVRSDSVPIVDAQMEKRRKSSVPGIDRLLVVTSGVILLHNDFPSWSEFTLFGVDNTQVYGDDGDDGVDSVDSLIVLIVSIVYILSSVHGILRIQSRYRIR